MSGERAASGPVTPSSDGGAGVRLAVTRLSLRDFRSYSQADLMLDGRPVVLAGANGAGKTNVLEALSLLAPGRGLRTAKLAEMARKDPAGAEGFAENALPRPWAVSVTVCQGADETKIGTGTEPGTPERRVVRINGAPAANAGALSERIRLVWLTPAMDRLFMDGAAGRRRFLDRLILGHDPAHGARAAAYERAMRDRNRLLNDGVRDPSWFEALEAQMAEHGAALAQARVAYLARLRSGVDAWGGDPHMESFFPRADLALEGEVEAWAAQEPQDAVQAQLQRRLADGRPQDMAAGRTLLGPHRCDLTVRHRAKAMAAGDCSTGEQKALLIGLVLANARLAMERDGRPPILLLDEIAAHLDAERRGALFDEICRIGAQAWMTGTDTHLFEGFKGRAQIIWVENSHMQVQDGA